MYDTICNFAWFIFFLNINGENANKIKKIAK